MQDDGDVRQEASEFRDQGKEASILAAVGDYAVQIGIGGEERHPGGSTQQADLRIRERIAQCRKDRRGQHRVAQPGS